MHTNHTITWTGNFAITCQLACINPTYVVYFFGGSEYADIAAILINWLRWRERADGATSYTTSNNVCVCVIISSIRRCSQAQAPCPPMPIRDRRRKRLHQMHALTIIRSAPLSGGHVDMGVCAFVFRECRQQQCVWRLATIRTRVRVCVCVKVSTRLCSIDGSESCECGVWSLR